jgi:hypothetical protein
VVTVLDVTGILLDNLLNEMALALAMPTAKKPSVTRRATLRKVWFFILKSSALATIVCALGLK